MVCTLDTGRWAVGANLEPNLRCWFQKVVTLKLNVCRYVDNDWDDAKTSIYCLTQQAARSCGSRESLNVKKHAAAIFCKITRAHWLRPCRWGPSASQEAQRSHFSFNQTPFLCWRVLSTMKIMPEIRLAAAPPQAPNRTGRSEQEPGRTTGQSDLLAKTARPGLSHG